MSFEAKVTATSLAEEISEAFVEDAAVAYEAYDELRLSRGIPESDVDVVLTDDFVADVERFSGDREGAFLTYSWDRDGDQGRPGILVDADAWGELGADTASAFGSAFTIYTIGQHLGSLLVRGARRAGGVPAIGFDPTPERPNPSGRLIAYDLSRKASGAYRAVGLGYGILGRAVELSASVDTGIVDEFARAMAASAVDSLATDLNGLYPVWPDAVQEYRETGSGLGEMFMGIVADMDPYLRQIANTQAHADTAGLPDYFEQEPFSSVRAVQLYLGAPWAGFANFLRSRPVLPDLDEIAGYEAEVLAAGEAMVRAIWASLGLTVPEHHDGRLEVRVSTPRR